jgi:S1-C subfamily serine protease
MPEFGAHEVIWWTRICSAGSAARHQNHHRKLSTLARHRKPVSKLLNSVVVVGLWDAQTREIRGVGSGFIVDKNLVSSLLLVTSSLT